MTGKAWSEDRWRRSLGRRRGGSRWEKKTPELLKRLEREAGFANPYSYRIGPCLLCSDETDTFWIPELEAWVCPECFYSEPPIMM